MVIVSKINTERLNPLTEEEKEELNQKRQYERLVNNNYDEDDDITPEYKIEPGETLAVVDFDKDYLFFEMEGDKVKFEFLSKDNEGIVIHTPLSDIISYYEKNEKNIIKHLVD